MGWQSLNERYLILRSKQGRRFLIKLLSACNDLPFANSIQVNQGSTSNLNAKFDSIRVLGQLQQKCTIDSIYELNALQRQALLDFSN